MPNSGEMSGDRVATLAPQSQPTLLTCRQPARSPADAVPPVRLPASGAAEHARRDAPWPHQPALLPAHGAQRPLPHFSYKHSRARA
jgi:hypothetical protein